MKNGKAQGSLTRAVVEKLLVIFVIYSIAHSSVFQVKLNALHSVYPRSDCKLNIHQSGDQNE